jgi:hypothetical protein
MNGLRFSQALVPGLIAGILSIFTSWLWMGAIFHRFQKLTPGTWRRETGLSYFLSSALHILAACGIAFLFTIVVPDRSEFFSAGIGGSIRFALACWSIFALPIIVEGAIFINLHPLVVLGRLLRLAVHFAARDGDYRLVGALVARARCERGGGGNRTRE